MTLLVTDYGIDDSGYQAEAVTNLRLIVAATATKHGVEPKDVFGHSRRAPIARARQEVMYRARLMGKSLTEIGKLLRRDHTTIMHGIAAHMKREGISA
jgi:chromosomal replication initiation ATPase DnaA